MHLAALLAELRARGVSLSPTAEGIRYEAPRGVLTPQLREALVAHKSDVLAQLLQAKDFQIRTTLAPEGQPAAWRIYSRRLNRELWVCRDPAAVCELRDDGALEGLPAILAEDVEGLRCLDDSALGRVLDALAVWPGSRIEAVIGHSRVQ